jgi:hypothetical protein
MRTLRVLAWTVGVLFVIGTALQLVDDLDLYASPPAQAPANMVEGRLAAQDYRSAIWPIFALGNLAFGVGFMALVGLGLALRSRVARRDPQHVLIPTTFGVGGVLGSVAQLMIVGAAYVTVQISYCDCGFKNEEVVSQIWGQMLIEGAAQWLLNAAGILAAIGIVAVDASFRRRMPAGWSIVSWLTAIGLILTVAVGYLDTGDVGRYLLAFVSGVLVPIWTIWLGAALRDDVEPGPGVAAEPAPA